MQWKRTETRKSVFAYVTYFNNKNGIYLKIYLEACTHFFKSVGKYNELLNTRIDWLSHYTNILCANRLTFCITPFPPAKRNRI